MRRVLLALLVLTCSASVEHGLAQTAPRRGFWIETGTGTGAVRNACSGCEEVAVAYGASSHLRVGSALSAKVSIGVEVFAFSAADFNLSPTVLAGQGENVSIAPIILWYVGESGFFLKGGVGLARGNFKLRSDSGAPVDVSKTGSGLAFGLGFDVAVHRLLSLTANLSTYVTAIGDVTVGDALVDDAIATVYEAGIALTLR